jgi:hypothetical protein
MFHLYSSIAGASARQPASLNMRLYSASPTAQLVKQTLASHLLSFIADRLQYSRFLVFAVVSRAAGGSHGVSYEKLTLETGSVIV